MFYLNYNCFRDATWARIKFVSYIILMFVDEGCARILDVKIDRRKWTKNITSSEVQRARIVTLQEEGSTERQISVKTVVPRQLYTMS